MARQIMPIDPSQVSWDSPHPDMVVWDDQKEQPSSWRGNAFGGLAQGVMDTLNGGAQLLYHSLPQSVTGVIDNLNNAIADKTGMLSKIPAGGVDEMVQNAEREYQEARKAAGRSGFDAARLAGNFASTAPLAYAAPAAATLKGQMLAGALSGAGASAFQPVTQGNYWSEKAKQAAIGGAAGAIAPAVVGAASRVISPQTSDAAKTLLDEGVNLTPGQIAGGALQRIEQGAESIPFTGDVIKNSSRQALEQFNQAVANRALAPLGQRVPSRLVGNDLVDHVDDVLGSAYDEVLSKMDNIASDPQAQQEITNLQGLVSQYGGDVERKFNQILDNQFLNKFTEAGRISGEQMKQVDSELGRLARGYRGDPSFDNRQLGDAILSARQTLRDLVERSHPDLAPQLQAINQGYANYAILRDAASRIGSKEGVFSAAQLRGAVRAADFSRGKGNFAKGDALLQDLADAGEKVLGSKVPDSGTAFRAGVMFGAPGLAGAAGSIPTSIAYSAPGKYVLRKLLTARPDYAKKLAQQLMYLVPASTVGASDLANQ